MTTARWTLALLPLLALGCPSLDETCDADPVDRTDADLDGYVLADDCDDNDPAIHPGAFDACDGVDNDCNDTIDDGYPDVDGDGAADCDPVEVCDGVDNDGDGAIDELEDDFDGDGVADCLDDACDVPTTAADTVELDGTCDGPPVVDDPWDVVVAWDGGEDFGGYGARVGRILDLDGDGDVDSDDPATIAVTELAGDSVGIRLMDGVTGSTERVLPGRRFNAMALADIDGDGAAEILSDIEGYTALFETDGTEVWRDTVRRGPTNVVADLDGDGNAEVFCGGRALNAADGTLIFDLGEDYRMADPAIGDVDLDGDQDIVYGAAVWDASGSKRFDLTGLGEEARAWPAIVQTDADPEAEIVVLSGSGIDIFDHTGTLVQSNAIAGSGFVVAGPPTVSDLDGDGDLEMAFLDRGIFPAQLTAVELDGTVKWRVFASTLDGTPDSFGAASFDFDADGAHEVVYGGLNGLRIFDGATGTVRFHLREPWNNNYDNVPVIADIDNDGAAEIVSVVRASRRDSVIALEQRSDTWPAAPAQWTQLGWADGNVGLEGAVLDAPTYWQTTNVWRAQSLLLSSGIDFTAEITDVCVSSCDASVGVAAVAVRVANQGPVDLTGDVSVSLFAVDGETRTHLGSQVVSSLASTRRTASLVFDVALTDLGPDGLEVQVDADDAQNGVVDECSETNNTDVWAYDVCP